jgi:y4mF family transcriptional regulator
MKNSIGEIIKLHRKKSGLTQSGLAKLAGCGKTVIFDIEHGKATVQLDTLLKICLVLNIRLFFESPIMEKTNVSEENK